MSPSEWRNWRGVAVQTEKAKYIVRHIPVNYITM